MKLRPVTKFDRENMSTSKNMTMTLFQQIVTSLPFFQFMANLQSCGSRIPDGWSIKFTLSLTITFYLTKTENRTKKSLTHVWYYILLLWAEVLFFPKIAYFGIKNADIIKIKKALVLKGIISETTLDRLGVTPPSPYFPRQNEPQKSPPLINP